MEFLPEIRRAMELGRIQPDKCFCPNCAGRVITKCLCMNCDSDDEEYEDELEYYDMGECNLPLPLPEGLTAPDWDNIEMPKTNYSYVHSGPPLPPDRYIVAANESQFQCLGLEDKILYYHHYHHRRDLDLDLDLDLGRGGSNKEEVSKLDADATTEEEDSSKRRRIQS